MSRETFSLILQEAKMLAPGVRHLVFTRADGQALQFIPGQFITVHFTTETGLARRSYSIASKPGETAQLEIAVSYVEGGLATGVFASLQPGESITASGPFGRLILRDEQVKRYFLIATGTGVTPYRSMLKQLEAYLSIQPELSIKLLFGTRTREDLLYADDFLDFAYQHPRFSYLACYSRMPAQAEYERQGYVQNLLDEYHLDPETDVVYLCGNPHMIDATFAKLTELGFPSPSVRREKYVSSK